MSKKSCAKDSRVCTCGAHQTLRELRVMCNARKPSPKFKKMALRIAHARAKHTIVDVEAWAKKLADDVAKADD